MKIIKDNLGKVAITCNGYWDKALPYDRLCIVITSLKADNISTFISRKPVPAGIDITNEEYWMRLGNSINFKTINGKSILGEGDIFIDTSLYRIVNELPTDNIEEKIYVLVSYGSEIDNDHTEWVYIDNQWEKLGDSTFVRFEDLGIEVTAELSRNELKRFVTNGRSVGTINTIDVTKGENGSINISGKKSSRGGGYHDYYSLRDYSIEIPVVNDTNNGLVPKLPSNFGYYFPISRISPNSVDNSTDWYSFEEPSVYNRDDEGPLNTVNIELSVCKAGSDIPNVLWDISIPAVSNNGAGVMTPQSYNDLVSIKAKTDALPTYVMNGNTINHIANSNGVTLQFPISRLVNDASNPIPYSTITIPIATTSQAGVMSADDKTKLDSITNNSLLPNTNDVAEGISILTVGKTSHAGSTQTNVEWSKLSVGRNAHEMNIKGGNASENTIITLPPANNNEAGLLPAYLYTTLNNKQGIISGLKISSDTNTTTSDYIVLTRADYQSILDRLAALENK